MNKATVKQVKDYFDIKSTPEFMIHWKTLSTDEQDFFKVEVGKQVNNT